MDTAGLVQCAGTGIRAREYGFRVHRGYGAAARARLDTLTDLLPSSWASGSHWCEKVTTGHGTDSAPAGMWTRAPHQASPRCTWRLCTGARPPRLRCWQPART